MFAETDARSPILLRLVQGEGKAIIFTRTKMTAERLSESLTSAGVPAARLHGDLNQNQRNRNLQRFMSGEVRVLVATDVAARGIHVDDIAMVIQVDPPEEYKTYLHRSGRTGRAGKQGTVITLVPRSRRRKVEDLLRRAERDAIYMDVRQDSPILAEIAGPIAPAPEVLVTSVVVQTAVVQEVAQEMVLVQVEDLLESLPVNPVAVQRAIAKRD
jgi:superfamily II DNA/RNA helicase